MTRINCGIPPAELVDKHLLAEHREIKRIPNTVKSGKAKVENIPTKFCLGKGHVKFFYDKLMYLHIRYDMIYEECINRGFKVQDYSQAFEEVPNHLYNWYEPSDQDRALVRERIKERLSKTGVL